MCFPSHVTGRKVHKGPCKPWAQGDFRRKLLKAQISTVEMRLVERAGSPNKPLPTSPRKRLWDLGFAAQPRRRNSRSHSSYRLWEKPPGPPSSSRKPQRGKPFHVLSCFVARNYFSLLANFFDPLQERKKN